MRTSPSLFMSEGNFGVLTNVPLPVDLPSSALTGPLSSALLIPSRKDPDSQLPRLSCLAFESLMSSCLSWGSLRFSI